MVPLPPLAGKCWLVGLTLSTCSGTTSGAQFSATPGPVGGYLMSSMSIPVEAIVA